MRFIRGSSHGRSKAVSAMLVEGHSTLQTVMAAMLAARAALKLEMEKLHKVILKIVREDESVAG